MHGPQNGRSFPSKRAFMTQSGFSSIKSGRLGAGGKRFKKCTVQKHENEHVLCSMAVQVNLWPFFLICDCPLSTKNKIIPNNETVAM